MKGDRRRQFVWSFLRIFVRPIFRLFFGYKAINFKLEKNKPYVILSNHVAQIDPIYLAISFKRKINFIAYASVCYGKYQKLLYRYFAPIPKTKGKSDLMTIRESLKVIKNNGIVGLFPSGDCSFSGVESHIDRSIIKFLRMMKADLLLYRLDGIYGTSPRWGRKRNKGKARGQVKKVLTVDEMNALSDEELYNTIIEVIGGNNLSYIEGNLYKGKYCAEYLERTLYVCPDCGEVGTMFSHREAFTCLKCGYQVTYQPDLHFKLVKGKNYLPTVNDWYNYCIDALKEKDKNDQFPNGQSIFVDNFEFLKTEWLEKSEQGYQVKHNISFEDGKISLYRDKFTIESKDGKEIINLPVKSSKVIFHGKKSLVIYNEQFTYTIHGYDRFCGMKYLHLVNEVFKNELIQQND